MDKFATRWGTDSEIVVPGGGEWGNGVSVEQGTSVYSAEL